MGFLHRLKDKIVSAAGYYVEVKGAVKTIGTTAAKAKAFGTKVNDAADSLNRTLPKMEVMGGSVCDNVAFFTRFQAVASGVGIGVNIVAAYQGCQALDLIGARLEEVSDELRVHSTLNAMQAFPQHVHDFIAQKLDKTFDDNKSHWFFVYHPDTFWRPAFWRLCKDEKLGRRFAGYNDNLDSLFTFLVGARSQITRDEWDAQSRGIRRRPVKFHVLIPAHQPTVIEEFLKFPDDVGDFVIEGQTYGSQALVWLNVPAEQERFLSRIGNWKPSSPSTWDCFKDWLAGHGSPDLGEPRVLGRSADDGDESGMDEQSPQSEYHNNDDYELHDPPLRDDYSLPGGTRTNRHRHRSAHRRNRSTSNADEASRGQRQRRDSRRR